MDYKEFREEELSELSDCQTDDERRAQYLETVCSTLIDFDQVRGFTPFFFDGTGRRGRRLSIDGFFFEEDDGTLNLFSCMFFGEEDTETVTKSDIEKACLRARYYLEACLDGSILDSLNGSDEQVVQTVGTIVALDGQIQRVRFNVVTDAIRGDREIKISMEDIDGIPCSVSLWDVKAYCDLMLSKPEKEKTIIEFDDYGCNGIRCIRADGIGSDSLYDAYLCIMPGRLLSDLYTKYGGRLLESNVRSFLTIKKKVNAGIRDTIMNAPECFFAYNNGLSTTASGIMLEKDDDGYRITAIEDFQIVNGGQTTALINYVDRNPKIHADLDSVYVPMKLCVINGQAPSDFVPNISQYSNSQNAVSKSDFFSNSKFNIKLEKISRRLLAPPRPGSIVQTRWFYERTAGSYMQAQAFMSKAEMNDFQKTNPKNQRVTKTDLAKYRNTYAKLPHIVSKGTSASMSVFVESAKKLWGSEEESDKTIPGSKVNDNYYKDSIAIAIMFKDLEKSISNKELAPWYNSGYRANLVTYSIAKLVDMLDERGGAINLDLIWKNQSINDALRRQLLVIAEMTLEKIQDPKRKIDDVREWCKRQECWDSVKAMDIDMLEACSYAVTKKAGSYERRAASRSDRTRTIDSIKADIVNRGDDFWRAALEWGTENGILGKKDRELISVAANIHHRQKVPSDSQAIAINNVYNKLKQAGFDS